MSDSTTNLDQLSASQSNQEARMNEMNDAMSVAASFGRRAAGTLSLNWGFYGVPRYYISTTPTIKANGQISLTASSTRFVSVDRSLNLAQVATAFDADKLALYKAVTGTGSITSYEDHRDPHHLVRFLYGRFVLAMADANKTLTYEQAMCESMELTGALTALRDVVVPTVVRSYIVFANVTGGFGVRVKTSAGTGITIADGKRAIIECDGTNVVRVSADV
jgi:hypothetical protein